MSQYTSNQNAPQTEKVDGMTHTAPTPEAAAHHRKVPSPARNMIDRLENDFQSRPAVTIAPQDQLAHALHQGKLGDFEAASPFAACLIPLLQALGWRGQIRQLTESLPHFANGLNQTEFRNTLAHLGYATKPADAELVRIDPRLFPCLFLPEDNDPWVVLERHDNHFRIFDSAVQAERNVHIDEVFGRAYFVSAAHTSFTGQKSETITEDNWIGALAQRFKGTFLQLLSITFLLNIMALMVPLFIMSIYDKVIPSQSTTVLAYLASGILLAIGCEIGLRTIRAKMMAYLGARVENIVANATFRQLMSLPPLLTESAPIGNQVSRLKEFDTIRDLFSGSLINVALELPFVLLFIAVIAILGGSLAFVPVVMMMLFAVIAIIILPTMRNSVKESSKARAARHSFLVEAMGGIRTIKQTAGEEKWLERYRDLSAESSYRHFRTSQISLLLQSLAQTIMMAAGVATVGLGVLKVLEGTMSIGALIACMALVWRVLSPLQNLFLSLTRAEQIKTSLKQINQLMKLKTERPVDNTAITQRHFKGRVMLERVSFRYRADNEPALLGVNARIEPGEMVAIIGPNAAGKSTLLKMIAGLYRPQAGQVILDDMDIRQINPLELRQALGYVPQICHLFHGSIAQNIRLSHPTASEEELQEACRLAGVLDDILALPKGFETRIGDQSIQKLPSSFKQRLSLARGLVKKAPILLLDEPAKTLDMAGDAAFIETLKTLRGQSTVIMTTHRPSHIRLADKVIVLEAGMMTHFGTPDEVLPQIYGGQK
ncbi:MAG: lantibiotic ABC transporter [Kordiimonas sp.]|nr:lantibiotic ABC transporter [Kordiimonas sp.]